MQDTCSELIAMWKSELKETRRRRKKRRNRFQKAKEGNRQCRPIFQIIFQRKEKVQTYSLLATNF